MGKKNVCAKPANENPKKVVFFSTTKRWGIEERMGKEYPKQWQGVKDFIICVWWALSRPWYQQVFWNSY